MVIPRIPVGRTIEMGIDFLVEHCSFATRAFSHVLDTGLRFVQTAMLSLPPWVFILAIGLITWRLTKSKRIGLFSIAGLLLILNMGLWKATCQHHSTCYRSNRYGSNDRNSYRYSGCHE